MDTYEENGLTPEPIPDEAAQQPLQEQAELSPAEKTEAEPSAEEGTVDGFYHGAGAGAIEETASTSMPTQEVAEDAKTDTPADTPASQEKPRHKKKNIGKKILKCGIASLLIIALVVTGCAISVGVMNQYWRLHNQAILRNFEEQIKVLRQELEAYQNNQSETVLMPAQGLTPTQIYERNIQSIVAVNSIIRTTNNGQVYDAQASGSGFVFSADGYIVTNHHVIENATSVSVIFADGRKLAAQVVGADATNDIAMLKVAALDLKPVTIGSSDALRVGDQVVAIGNALGELSFSLTAGYVSGTDRNIATDGSVLNMIQTDASINSGNSGGPLFNAKGEVVGITTAKYSGTTSSGASIEGIGFAIPMDDVYKMLADLRQYGYITGAYLGVMVRDVDPSVAEAYGFPVGAYVQEATLGFAAHKAGLRAKDIIVNLGGYQIQSMSDLTRALRKFEAGETSTIVVWRSGEYIVLNITFDEKPHN